MMSDIGSILVGISVSLLCAILFALLLVVLKKERRDERDTLQRFDRETGEWRHD